MLQGQQEGIARIIFFYIKMYAHDILYENVGIHKGDCQNILTAGVIPDSNWVMKATCCADIWTYFGPQPSLEGKGQDN